MVYTNDISLDYSVGKIKILVIKLRQTKLSKQSTIEKEIAMLLVEVLNLEDIVAEEIDPNEQIFGEGLGLDSIDALEIALALSQAYGVQMKAEDEETQGAFATLRALGEFVEKNKTI
jgi:acyl carrier protein